MNDGRGINVSSPDMDNTSLSFVNYSQPFISADIVESFKYSPFNISDNLSEILKGECLKLSGVRLTK